MALYIHGPLRCKNLLGRIPNPHSCHALAAPQHAPGPRSDARSRRTTPGEIVHRLAAPDPAATPAGERPAPPVRPRSDRPAASRTHAAHTHTAQIRHPAAHAGSCAALAASPQTARKPARLSSRTGFFFCMMEPDTARRKRLGRTTQPDRRPHCPLHPYSAGEISHRSGKERTTSTTTAPHPTRAGPHWKPTADPAGSSNHHAHDQTAYAPAARPVHAAPVLVMGKPPGGHSPTHSKPHPDRPQISQPEPPRPHRRASEARHSVRHTARHFFKSKAQIRHILTVSHPL